MVRPPEFRAGYALARSRRRRAWFSGAAPGRCHHARARPKPAGRKASLKPLLAAMDDRDVKADRNVNRCSRPGARAPISAKTRPGRNSWRIAPAAVQADMAALFDNREAETRFRGHAVGAVCRPNANSADAKPAAPSTATRAAVLIAHPTLCAISQRRRRTGCITGARPAPYRRGDRSFAASSPSCAANSASMIGHSGTSPPLHCAAIVSNTLASRRKSASLRRICRR